MLKGGGASKAHATLFNMFLETLKLSWIIFPGPIMNVISEQLAD